jgi:hypothetical protein
MGSGAVRAAEEVERNVAAAGKCAAAATRLADSAGDQ